MSGSYKLRAIFASAPKTTRGKPTALKTDPSGKRLLYTNGTTVFIRNVENPIECDTYTEHSKETTVAAFAPSGNYIASGDAGGKIRIWDALGSEHILKYEYQVLGGPIKDIAWTEDSKRIAVGGEGRDKFAHVFMWDTGTSVGTLSGMSKTVNNVDIKQNRPYRLATAGEDYLVCFFEGPPFKYKESKKEHTNFVNCLRFAPNGSVFASGGADGKCFVYDGKTGDFVGQMNDSEGRVHKGGVYGMCWSPDSKELLTVSADKTAKIWNVEKRILAVEFKLEDKIDNQVLGCAWAGKNIVAVTLDGDLKYFDRENPSTPSRIVQGHNKGIMSIAVSEDGESVFSASYEGLLCHWEAKTGVCYKVPGKPHTNQVTSMSVSGDCLVSCGMDDMVRFVNIPGREFLDERVGMDSQPCSVVAGKDGLVIVACAREVVVIRNHRVVHKESVDFEPSAVALHPSQALVAVGSSAEKPITLFDLDQDVLKQRGTCGGNGNVTVLRFSTDGSILASGDSKKTLKLFKGSQYKEFRSWAYHAAKINDIAFSPGSHRLATCSVDSYVHIWDVADGIITHKMKATHGLAVNITCVRWLDNNSLVTSGQQDCSLRVWNIISK